MYLFRVALQGVSMRMDKHSFRSIAYLCRACNGKVSGTERWESVENMLAGEANGSKVLQNLKCSTSDSGAVFIQVFLC
jgi:hypothetical protein